MTARLIPESSSGWKMGLGVLLSKENKNWWGTHRWLGQTLLWTLLLNGLVALVLFVAPGMTTPEGQPVLDNDPVPVSYQIFFSLGTTLLAIGTIILTQDDVIGEKLSGTAAWILSKPVSRSAFLLSKFFAFLPGMLVTMLVIPGTFAYLQIVLLKGADLSIVIFTAGLAMMAIHTIFYLTLTMLLGVLVDSRGPLLAVTLGAVLGGKLVIQFFSPLARVTPFLLPDLVPLYISGDPMANAQFLSIMLASTAIWSLIFVAIALWKFNELEF